MTNRDLSYEPLQPNRKRGINVVFRVTEQEQDLIAEKMAESGISNREAYLRKMSIDGLVIKLDLSDVRELIRLLSITSNNMNQIAKRANETRNIYEADIIDLQNHYDKLWDKANDILKHLSKISL